MKRQEHNVDLVKAAFIVLIVKVMASSSLIMPWSTLVDNLCVIFGVCVMVAKICTLTFTIGKFLALALTGLLTLYTCVSTGMYDMLVTVVAICLLINEDLDEYISEMLKIQTIILICHIAVAGIMTLTGAGDYLWNWTEGRRFRFNGGFNHTNVLSSYVLSCMMMFAWKRFRQITANQFGWMTCIAILTYVMTRSRTGLLLNIVLLLLLFFMQNENRLAIQAVNFTLPVLFPALSALIFWAQRQYTSGNSIVRMLDTMLTGRIKYAAYAYVRSGITLLPRPLDYASVGVVAWTPEWNLNTFTFDNLYSFIFMQLGIIWIAVISGIIFVASRKLDIRNRLFLLIWILYCIVEVHGLNCFKFFPLILLTTLLSEKGGRGTSETP